MAFSDKEIDGVVNALFVAAGAAALVFVVMVAFNPEERANREGNVPNQAAEFDEFNTEADEEATPTPGPDGETPEDARRRRNTLTREERARALGRWNR